MAISFDLKTGLSGLITSGVPLIFKGMINEWLNGDEYHPRVDVKTVATWVTKNKDLLVLFKEYGGEDFDNVLGRAGHFVKDSSWFTSEWLIDACREEHPDIASLFLGWEESRVWLDMQVEKFRDAFNQINSPIEVENQPKQINKKSTPSTPEALPESNKNIKGCER
jgi:hypothetical protein